MLFRSIRTTLIVIFLLAITIPSCIIGFSTYSMAKAYMDEAGKEELKHSTIKAISMINLLNQEVQAGHITQEEAYEKLRIELIGEKNSEFTRTFKDEHKIEKSGYIFAIDANQIVVMTPENEGQDLKDVKSEDGLALGEEFLKVGKDGGYVTYKWPNPLSGKVETKTTYVLTDSHWGWTIAAGAYLSEFNEHAVNFAKMVSIVTAISVVVAGIITFLLATRITKPIVNISNELNLVASGNFTGEPVIVHRKDELGRLARDFNLMKQHTKQLLQQVSLSTEHIAASSEQLAASADDSKKATNEVTHSIQYAANASMEVTNGLQESAQSIEEVSVAIQNLADHAHMISETSTAVSEQAQSGQDYVNKTATQMNSIHHKVSESSQTLQLLEKSSQEINKITKVITDIANQTNLLALNAAIEAARAGEHGKGFAVVADEVRKLAEQSQNSTKQIAALISQIQDQMIRSSNSMNDVIIEVQEGLTIVNQTETSFNEIVKAMQSLGFKVSDMAAMVEEMSASAEKVTATISHISDSSEEASGHAQQIAAATEEQLASVDQIAESAESLSTLAGKLQEQVSQFKI